MNGANAVRTGLWRERLEGHSSQTPFIRFVFSRTCVRVCVCARVRVFLKEKAGKVIQAKLSVPSMYASIHSFSSLSSFLLSTHKCITWVELCSCVYVYIHTRNAHALCLCSHIHTPTHTYIQVLRRLGFFPTQRTRRASHGYDFEGSRTYVLDNAKRYVQHTSKVRCARMRICMYVYTHV
jgi:hypothetical protein